MLTGSTCSAPPSSSISATTICSIKSSHSDPCHRSRQPRATCSHQVAVALVQLTSSCSRYSRSDNSSHQRYLLTQPQVSLRSQQQWQCRQGSNDAPTTNGAGGSGGRDNSNGNGNVIADSGTNGGEGSNGSSGGSSRPNSKFTGSGDHGDGSSNNKPPASQEQLVVAAAAAVLGFIAVIAAGALKWSAEAQQTASAALAAVSKGDEHSVAGLNTKDSINTLKRLLREVFQEHLGFKSRLDALETAAAVKLEAADDYQLQVSAADSSRSSWLRSPVRMSGWLSAAGILPWTQEAAGVDTTAMLVALGANGRADGRLALHSVLAGGKRRVTAELHNVQQDDGQPALQLARLLYRVQVKQWLQLMIAPLGGSLDAVARGITPIQADYGCTQALRKGHGLSVFDHSGSGKAAAVSKGCLSAAAGFFAGGTSKASLLQLQLKGHEGQSLSLVAAKRRPMVGSNAREEVTSSSYNGPGFRFLGIQAPGCSSRSDSSSCCCDAASTVLGAAGVLPIGESFTATAWAEKPSKGQAGWGLGLYSQPDHQGFETGIVLGKPSSAHAAFRTVQVPLFCEVTAKMPVGDGLSISPGVLATFRKGKGSLAYMMQSSWRF